MTHTAKTLDPLTANQLLHMILDADRSYDSWMLAKDAEDRYRFVRSTLHGTRPLGHKVTEASTLAGVVGEPPTVSEEPVATNPPPTPQAAPPTPHRYDHDLETLCLIALVKCVERLVEIAEAGRSPLRRYSVHGGQDNG